MSTSRCPILVALLTLAVVLTCGQRAAAADDLASVNGTITVDGKPLPSGRILFHLGDGQFVGAKIKEDGTFKMERVPAGKYKVTVEAAVGAKIVLPARYSAEDKSELRVEVKKGDNTFNFDLWSR